MDMRIKDRLDELDAVEFMAYRAGKWILVFIILGFVAGFTECAVTSYIKLNQNSTHVYKIDIGGKCIPGVKP